jgi:hypothetical protein
MLVITADQIHSRDGVDLVGATTASLNERLGDRLPLPVDRNAGDEIQVIAPDGATALDIVLELARTNQWSIGIGAGEIRLPLPSATREANGSAFVAARAAITRAKKRATRFAVDEAPRHPSSDLFPTASEAEALIDLLLLLRSRRSDEGWQLFDLISAGRNQSEVARELDVTPQAISSRAKIAGVRIELASRDALARLLDNLDRKHLDRKYLNQNGSETEHG